VFLTNAHQNGIGARAGGPGAIGDPDALLFETDTGNQVQGTNIPTTAMTPMFAPDGLRLAFADYPNGASGVLAVMDFDPSARKATSYRKVYSATSAMDYPAWPFFLPDSKALVFAIGNVPDFSGMGAGIDPTITGALVPNSDLFFVDLATGTSKLMGKAMGFATEQDAASNTTYLPFGAEELHHNFYPTVAPVPAGGYFWAFFDSLRHYGNQGVQRQLWGTAIDVSPDGTYSTDPSHPPFYLSGQEPNTGNHRAFAALDPCMKDGDTCTSGTDCCGGFCYVPGQTTGEFTTEPVGSCNPRPPMTCAKTNDRCTSAADCCPPMDGQKPDLCIAGFCAMVQPVQ
jgi:hypothetical protein